MDGKGQGSKAGPEEQLQRNCRFFIEELTKALYFLGIGGMLLHSTLQRCELCV